MTVKSRVSRAWRALTGRRTNFEAAADNRLLLEWIRGAVEAEDLVKQEAPKLRARARDLARNNSYVVQFLTLLQNNVIGANGVALEAKVRDNSGNLNRVINDSIEEAWEKWSRKVTVDEKLSLVQLQKLLLRGRSTDGEFFVRLVNVGRAENFCGLQLEPIDPDLVDHSLNDDRGAVRIVNGIEMDERGRTLAYHVLRGSKNNRQRERIPASEIIHGYIPSQVGQHRGLTEWASVMVPLRMLHGYEEAEVVAARTAAAKMGFIKWVNPDDFDAEAAAEPVEMEANPGSIAQLPPGAEFQSWDPTHPTNAFGDFVKSILRKISTGFRVSYNALANDLEGVNYSSIRSGLLIERDHWRSEQRWWIDTFLRPVYERWLEQAVLASAVKVDSRSFAKLLEAKWRPRGWQWVDPLKDVQASIAAVQSGLGSRQDALGEKGLDFEDVCEALAEEKAIAEQYGIELSTGQPAPAAKNEATDDEDGDAEDDADAKAKAKDEGRAAVRLLKRANG